MLALLRSRLSLIAHLFQVLLQAQVGDPSCRLNISISPEAPGPLISIQAFASNLSPEGFLQAGGLRKRAFLSGLTQTNVVHSNLPVRQGFRRGRQPKTS